ncbi:MAG: uracil-DNA glycosylase [Chloroflexota bacterium]|nr:uracil-DNA glycosylase [Chloroflexota bacterium]MDE2947866.1 uracil-DNA glycosylase [Chloroflexota bacterium]
MMRLPINSQIDDLIHDLSNADLPPDAFNQYRPGDENNAVRRANLRLYLKTMKAREPAALLLMEAPGYRGCRLTGVPVTSRKVMLEGAPALDIFGLEAGFRDVADAGFERVYGEQSATIVWHTLSSLKALPMIWNTFPFHPHQPGRPLSNRRPRPAEIVLGVEFLRQILAMWDFEQLIAVGNVAYETLEVLRLDARKVRHPAHGGKREFVAGLSALLSIGA